jgi:hypothetical protein
MDPVWVRLGRSALERRAAELAGVEFPDDQHGLGAEIRMRLERLSTCSEKRAEDIGGFLLEVLDGGERTDREHDSALTAAVAGLPGESQASMGLRGRLARPD